MAKKKKTKVGSALSKIGSAIKGAVQKGTTNLKQAIDKSQVNKGGLLASVSNALGKSTQVSVPKSKTPAFQSSGQATISAPKKPNIFASAPNIVNIGGKNIALPRTQPGVRYTPQNIPSINGTTSSGTSNNSVSTLEKASAPDSADTVVMSARSPSINFSSAPSNSGISTTTMGIGSTAGSSAVVAGAQQASTQMLEEQKIAQQKMLEADGERKSILDQLFKQQEKEPTREELRQDYEEAYKIQEQTAEINSLEQDLDRVFNEISNQEAVARDRLGTNDFINNQIAQIRRNSEPIVNRLSSEIKWRSGLLSQDRALMNEAISDALADSRSRIENNRWFAQEYLGYADEKYKQAYNEYMKNQERAYDEKQSFLEYARDIAWEYAQNGIRLNINSYTITPEQLAEKINSNPLPQKSSGGSSGGYNFSQTQVNKGAVNAGVSLSEFVNLPGDIQNFFISSSSTIINDARDTVNAAKSGDLSQDEVVTILQNMGATQEVINYLTSGIQVQQDTPKQSFWSTLTKSIGSIFD